MGDGTPVALALRVTAVYVVDVSGSRDPILCAQPSNTTPED
jgi:hypothetical protein